ncbi:MAG TPA: sensor histidine kinase [Bryobacteraceae bacterium]|nr:sensor histidine kinase [Bryobacteraceae bacterium]
MTTDQKTFRQQTRLLLWGGFGGLVLLMAFLGLSALSFTSQIEVRQESLRREYVERDRDLEKLRSGIYISGTYARDYLLDDNAEMAATHKAAFLDVQRRIESELAGFEHLVRPDEHAVFDQFLNEVRTYLGMIDPTLDWNASKRQAAGPAFIGNEILPRRMLAVDLADRIHELSEQQYEANSQKVKDLFSSFRTRLRWLLVSTLGTGLLLAGLSLWRIFALERETEYRFQQILDAQDELKRLSAELVSAQEGERRRISRELHDEVGQVLSAIMLGLGNLRSAIERDDSGEALQQLQLVQDMTQRNANVVRNISLLLRPTMLDDLGLLPALKWLAREVSRTSGINVDVAAEGDVEELPEDHRTCIYRVVQEAVNNAVRHSGTRQIKIRVQQNSSRIRVSIQDDGKGFEPSKEAGLGILGMGERIARLGGSISLDSERGRGSIISFELPLLDEDEDLSGSGAAAPVSAHSQHPAHLIGL